jgi:hypothetical protein
LANRLIVTDAFVTHPDHSNLQGYIAGTFEIDQLLKPTDIFTAELGFSISGQGSDGVVFSATFIPDDAPEQRVPIFQQPVTYSTTLQSISEPLTQIQQEKRGKIGLRVDVSGSFNKDWAVWVNPRLVRP